MISCLISLILTGRSQKELTFLQLCHHSKHCAKYSSSSKLPGQHGLCEFNMCTELLIIPVIAFISTVSFLILKCYPNIYPFAYKR